VGQSNNYPNLHRCTKRRGVEGVPESSAMAFVKKRVANQCVTVANTTGLNPPRYSHSLQGSGICCKDILKVFLSLGGVVSRFVLAHSGIQNELPYHKS